MHQQGHTLCALYTALVSLNMFHPLTSHHHNQFANIFSQYARAFLDVLATSPAASFMNVKETLKTALQAEPITDVTAIQERDLWRQQLYDAHITYTEALPTTEDLQASGSGSQDAVILCNKCKKNAPQKTHALL